MSYSVFVRRAAEQEIIEAQRWYETQRHGLAAEFHREFGAVLGRLAESPLSYPVLYRDVRRAVLHRFPYLVWYRVQHSYLTVLACTHGRVDPGRVAARLRG